MFAARDYLDATHSAHFDLFTEGEPVWTALSRIGEYLCHRLASLTSPRLNGEIDERAIIGPDVYIGCRTVVEANAVIKGPAWIGDDCTVRSGAYIRENVIAGDGVTLGNSSEFKNCVLFDKVEAPHFNYVGDSILGYRAHLGAGVVCSNVRLDRQNVCVLHGGEKIDTGLRKFGAVVGDRTEVGCNSVLSPGSILGRDGIIFPCTHWRGILGDHQMVKNQQPLEIVSRKG